MKPPMTVEDVCLLFQEPLLFSIFLSVKESTANSTDLVEVEKTCLEGLRIDALKYGVNEETKEPRVREMVREALLTMTANGFIVWKTKTTFGLTDVGLKEVKKYIESIRMLPPMES